MLKALLIGLALATLSLPAAAADAKCDNAFVSKVQAKMDGISDPEVKKMASDHLMMAEASMKAGKLDDCATHIAEAMQALGM